MKLQNCACLGASVARCVCHFDESHEQQRKRVRPTALMASTRHHSYYFIEPLVVKLADNLNTTHFVLLHTHTYSHSVCARSRCLMLMLNVIFVGHGNAGNGSNYEIFFLSIHFESIGVPLLKI